MRVFVYDYILDGILEGARRNYPNEFFCLLGGDKKEKAIIVDEIIYIPHRQSRRGVVYDLLAVPVSDRVVGSVHSHPFPSGPSSADLRSFPHTGVVHAIVSYPFTERDIVFYDLKGRRVEFEVIAGQRASF